MAFNRYTVPQDRPTWEAPISENILLRGANQKEETAQRNLQSIQSALEPLMGIPTFGKDREQLSNIQNTIQDQLKGIAVNDLNNPQALGSIKGLIRSTVNSPDVQAIAQRGYTFAQMQKEKADALKKGENWISPGYEEAQKYYNGSDYIRDKSFSNDSFIGADLAKSQLEALKTIEPASKYVIENGRSIKKTYYTPDQLDQAYELSLNTPNALRTLQYNFAKKHESTNFNQDALSHLQDLKNKAQMAASVSNDPEAIDKYNQDIHNYELIEQNPEKYQEMYKNDIYKKELDLDKQHFIKSHNVIQESDEKADEYQMEGIKHLHRLDEIEAEYNAKAIEKEREKPQQIDTLPEYSDLKSGKLIDPTGDRLVDKSGLEYHSLATPARNVLDRITSLQADNPNSTNGSTIHPDEYMMSKDGKNVISVVKNTDLTSREKWKVVGSIKVEDIPNHDRFANKKGHGADGGKIPSPTTQADYNAIKKGTTYKDTDGKIKIKQ